MLQVTPQMKILVAVAPADFRKGIDGLVRLCKESLGHRVSSIGFAAIVPANRAIALLRSAIEFNREVGAQYDLARSLLALAAVKEEGRDDNRAEAIDLLKEMESVIPRAESWLLGDQYDEAVVAPEFDREAWEQEHGPISPQMDGCLEEIGPHR